MKNSFQFKLYLEIGLALASLFFFHKALALPSEGFEVFGFNQSSAKSAPAALFIQTLHVNPVWTSDYAAARVYSSVAVLGLNYLTVGYSQNIANKFNDRVSYFMRYDQRIWGHSLSVKLTHIDEVFLGTGKNILSADFNATTRIGASAQLYLVLGMYSRYGLNQWDQNPRSPFNFNTVDREYYPEATLGGRISLGRNHFATIDLNTRDAFNSYNADFGALDFSINMALTAKTIWTLASSTRFSSTFMGTGDIGMQTFMMGIRSEL